MNLGERTYLWYLAVLRIYIGTICSRRDGANSSAIFPKEIGSAVRLGISGVPIFFHGTNDFSWTMSRRITSFLAILS